jgi:hypothetical protein
MNDPREEFGLYWPQSVFPFGIAPPPPNPLQMPGWGMQPLNPGPWPVRDSSRVPIHPCHLPRPHPTGCRPAWGTQTPPTIGAQDQDNRIRMGGRQGKLAASSTRSRSHINRRRELGVRRPRGPAAGASLAGSFHPRRPAAGVSLADSFHRAIRGLSSPRTALRAPRRRRPLLRATPSTLTICGSRSAAALLRGRSASRECPAIRASSSRMGRKSSPTTSLLDTAQRWVMRSRAS